MGKTQNRIVKAMQDMGLVARPTLAQAVSQTIRDGATNVTMAVGTIGMEGIKASGRKTADVGRRVRKSEAARDVRRVTDRVRSTAGPVVSTAVTAVVVQALVEGIRGGATRAYDSASAARAARAARPATSTAPRHTRPARTRRVA